ncbi:Bug family tripartite tricarboxylate transporter substrate binding protein [Humitalea sp. 24SJ18S-53]|uniref:Bug family tripartite tricarboxylate transporter substrate binding protein n=1 Tax=Humitalea sp. 24SJ18S-53 TaxID=3422307 RepID=UPI003D67F3A1
MRRRPLLLAALAAPAVARAQPIAGGRPIRLVVPFPPGGAVDILGRLIAERLQTVIGQSVVVENRGGAGGLLGADVVAKGPADGSILGLISVTTLAAASYMSRNMPFDPQKDLTPVTQVTTGGLLCVVNAETATRRRWTDFRSVILWGRANPEGIRMGSSGTGTTSHLNIEAVNQATGARILHVPYRGGGPAINDLLSGTIDMMFDVSPALMPHVESGKFKAMAVSTAQRLGFAPDIPGYAEFADIGLGEMDVVTWNALMTAAHTPAPVVERLFGAIRQVAVMPDFIERLRPLGYDVVTSATPAALGALIAAEQAPWRRLVEISGARLD